MIAGKSVLAVVPARGGSKGVSRKNLVDVAGKPLIAWTIEAARASRYVDRVILSSEDEEIMATARTLGCDVPFVRPAALAADSTPCTETVLHAISVLDGYDYVVLLQPTSPLRTAEDIDGGIRLCVASGAAFCVSFTPLAKPLEWLFRIDEEMRPTPVFGSGSTGQRQDGQIVHHPNGAVYVGDVACLQQRGSFYGPDTRAYLMPATRSLDVDTPGDIELARQLLAGREGP